MSQARQPITLFVIMDIEEEKGVASEIDVTVSEYQKTSLSDLIGKCINKDLDL